MLWRWYSTSQITVNGFIRARIVRALHRLENKQKVHNDGMNEPYTEDYFYGESLAIM